MHITINPAVMRDAELFTDRLITDRILEGRARALGLPLYADRSLGWVPPVDLTYQRQRMVQCRRNALDWAASARRGGPLAADHMAHRDCNLLDYLAAKRAIARVRGAI